MNKRPVILADIARQAGVHVTTVSLALRNHPRLPECTRSRLQALAKEMGYAPDPALRALVAYRDKFMTHRNLQTIAYITNWTTRWGWKEVTAHPDFFAGAEGRANELGFRIEHFWMREPGLTHGRLNGILEARGIGGAIVASHVAEIDEALQFDWSHFSAVKIDYFPHHPKISNVTNDQCSIIRLAMQKVMASGYRRIGFVMHRGWDRAVDNMWSAGYLCEQQKIAPEDRIPLFLFPEREPAVIDETYAGAIAPARTFAQWFKMHKPEVLISKESFVRPRMESMGLRVPRDVGFVDVFLSDFGGRTAGVRQNHHAVGATAVDLLANQLEHNTNGIPDIPTSTFVEGTWFDGKSLPPKATDNGRGGSQPALTRKRRKREDSPGTPAGRT